MLKTREAATSKLSCGLGVPGGTLFFNSSQSGFLSAVVIYPVAFTKAANCALVTSVASIQKLFTVTVCLGYSSSEPCSLSAPIENVPPLIRTIPSTECDAGTTEETNEAVENR